MPREWEHLKVPGEAIAERDGRYELRITEELWEAAYFDRLRLTAIDHPEGTELHTNEKVGPASVAEPRTFVFDRVDTPPRVVARYPDGTTRDLRPQVDQADSIYAVPHRTKIRQGYVEPVTLEVDTPAGAEFLLLSGWIRPTDTSINVALSNDPRYVGPRPPTLSLDDSDPVGIGFPGGKTKTIVVPLPGDSASPRTAAITTSMEFGWDRVAVAFEGDVPREEQVCRLLSADLHYRGFSRRIREQNGGPELYDYDRFSDQPAWQPMHGRFTRYGDVRELLVESDDRLVVMGSGDEMSLTFESLPPVAAGWRRDFVLSCWGWDKDANLNTIHGDSSEPYPTRGVVDYPELHEFSERADTEYQTRRQPPFHTERDID